MKPSEEILKMKEDCELRYALQDPDTKAIATILNLVHLVGEILDRQQTAIMTLAYRLENSAGGKIQEEIQSELLSQRE